MHIFVGSTNPVKLNAVTHAAIENWPDVSVQGFEVESGVSNQPLSDEETRKGAENRAKAVLIELQTTNHETIGIGLEGGVFEHENGELWNTVWACVVDQSGHKVCANSERFKLPDSLSSMIRSGKEMGPAMDELIGSTNIKHHQGMIGVITNRFIDRTEMYASIAKLALGLWYGKDWENEYKN